MPEYICQLFQLERMCNTEHAFAAIKAAVGDENVAVWISPYKVAKCLYGNDRAGDGIPFRYSLLKKDFQGFPCAAAQLGKQTSVIEKYRRNIFGMLKRKCRWGTFLSA